MKNLNRILATAIAAAGLLGTAQPAYAKLTAAGAARLGADLTPMGAEKAGNKDGTIPAWTGGLCAPPAGWTPAKGYVDPFANDKPKFVITKANAAQYKDKLTPGTLALLAKYDNFKMPFYETRRTACYPDSVYAEEDERRGDEPRNEVRADPRVATLARERGRDRRSARTEREHPECQRKFCGRVPHRGAAR